MRYVVDGLFQNPFKSICVCLCLCLCCAWNCIYGVWMQFGYELETNPLTVVFFFYILLNANIQLVNEDERDSKRVENTMRIMYGCIAKRVEIVRTTAWSQLFWSIHHISNLERISKLCLCLTMSVSVRCICLVNTQHNWIETIVIRPNETIKQIYLFF